MQTHACACRPAQAMWSKVLATSMPYFPQRRPDRCLSRSCKGEPLTMWSSFSLMITTHGSGSELGFCFESCFQWPGQQDILLLVHAYGCGIYGHCLPIPSRGRLRFDLHLGFHPFPMGGARLGDLRPYGPAWDGSRSAPSRVVFCAREVRSGSW